jgi:hypothetical protein
MLEGSQHAVDNSNEKFRLYNRLFPCLDNSNEHTDITVLVGFVLQRALLTNCFVRVLILLFLVFISW